MLYIMPGAEEMTALLGKPLYEVWEKSCALIEADYDMDRSWGSGGKAWTYEYKYRRGGKTLCALYAKENSMGFMVILGRAERLKFEQDRESYTQEVQRIYDGSPTYHDGKWMMFELKDTTLFNDLIRLLRIKRRPNRGAGRAP